MKNHFRMFFTLCKRIFFSVSLRWWSLRFSRSISFECSTRIFWISMSFCLSSSSNFWRSCHAGRTAAGISTFLVQVTVCRRRSFNASRECRTLAKFCRSLVFFSSNTLEKYCNCRNMLASTHVFCSLVPFLLQAWHRSQFLQIWLDF